MSIKLKLQTVDAYTELLEKEIWKEKNIVQGLKEVKIGKNIENYLLLVVLVQCRLGSIYLKYKSKTN